MQRAEAQIGQGGPGAPEQTVDPVRWPIRGSASGWQAELALHFDRRRGRTLVKKRQSGPLTIQRPFYPEGDEVCHVYLLHPPAGIVGGDDLRMSFDVMPDCHALITTPGATRWNFSRGLKAQAQQVARVAEAATFEWLPQETLLFDGAHARLATRVELEGNARFCGWEIIGLGRPSLQEPFEDGEIDFRFELFRDGEPLLLERQRGGIGGLPGLRGHAACATFVTTHADEAVLAASREVLSDLPDALCASTLIGDVLVVRGLAAMCEPLSKTFSKLWQKLRPLTMNRPASVPRIWHT